MNSHKEILIKSGMDPAIADTYLTILELGESTGPAIHAKTTLSRASVYNSLQYLLVGGYIEYRKVGRIAYYSPVHPQKLETLLQEKKRETALLEGEMNNTIHSLTGIYNLTKNKPGIRFFEGQEGLREALYHSLNAKETIYTFINNDLAVKYAKQIDEEYVRERTKRGIKKKIILCDTPSAREYVASLNNELTEAKLLDSTKYPFNVALEIYDNTLSYLSADDKNSIAFLIEHAEVANFHKTIFQYFWDTLPS
jgi:sugar-specific transcriptional regulator TrmB